MAHADVNQNTKKNVRNTVKKIDWWALSNHQCARQKISPDELVKKQHDCKISRRLKNQDWVTVTCASSGDSKNLFYASSQKTCFGALRNLQEQEKKQYE